MYARLRGRPDLSSFSHKSIEYAGGRGSIGHRMIF